MIKLFFEDTETTGVDFHKNGITQIAGMIYFLDKEYVKKAEFNFSVKPFDTDEITEKALEITKKTREEIMGYDPPLTVYNKLTSLLGEHCDKYNKQDKFFFVGYNSRFDYDFMRKFFEKCGDQYFGSYFFFPPIDVMNSAIQNMIKRRHILPNFKLGTVADHLGIKVEGDFHDAMKDIEITRLIFDKFVDLKGDK